MSSIGYGVHRVFEPNIEQRDLKVNKPNLGLNKTEQDWTSVLRSLANSDWVLAKRLITCWWDLSPVLDLLHISVCWFNLPEKRLPSYYIPISTNQLAVFLTECRTANQISTDCCLWIIGDLIIIIVIIISRFIDCNSTSQRQTSIIFGPDTKASNSNDNMPYKQ